MKVVHGVILGIGIVAFYLLGVFAFFEAFAENASNPPSWLLRLTFLIAYFATAGFTTQFAWMAGVGVEAIEAKDKAERNDLYRVKP